MYTHSKQVPDSWQILKSLSSLHGRKAGYILFPPGCFLQGHWTMNEWTEVRFYGGRLWQNTYTLPRPKYQFSMFIFNLPWHLQLTSSIYIWHVTTPMTSSIFPDVRESVWGHWLPPATTSAPSWRLHHRTRSICGCGNIDAQLQIPHT